MPDVMPAPTPNSLFETRGEVLAEVRRILVDNLKIDRAPDSIDPDVPLFGTGLGLDSVDAVELVVALETALGVLMPEELHAPLHLRTVSTVVDFVLEQRHGHRFRIEDTPSTQPAPTDVTNESIEEMRSLREKVACLRRPDLLVLRLDTDDPFEQLDPLVPTDLYLRDGQLRQSLFLNESAHPIADLSIGHDDGALLVIVEGMDRETLASYVGPGLSTWSPLTDDHEVLSVHGPWAWELLSKVIGEDIVALPYLGFFHLDRGGICFRSGKTGEFGYDLLLPKDQVEGFIARLHDAGERFDLRAISKATLTQAKRETFFFDPAPWQKEDVTPKELQLRWRCSARKSNYRGAEALRAREAESRVVVLVSDAPLRGGVACEGAHVGRIVHSGFSTSIGRHVGHALVSAAHAQSGRRLDLEGGHAWVTSPPVLENRSLTVDPRRDRYGQERSA